MKVLGISLGHDTNFCLVEDGKVVEVIEVERFFRQKRYKISCFSLEDRDISSGFQFVNVKDLRSTLKTIIKKWGNSFDYVAVQNQKREDEFNNLIKVLEEFNISYNSIDNLNHHLCHAAGAYFTSPFEESLILSYDGAGNDGNTIFFKGEGSSLEYLEVYTLKFGGSYNNLGFICNISPDISGTTSGKTMGLTSYGNVIEDWLPVFKEHILSYLKKPQAQSSDINPYGKAHVINWDYLSKIPEIKAIINEDGSSKATVNDKISHDICKTAQRAWSECVINLVEQHRETSKNLCIVGGCALNGVTNYQIQKKLLFDKYHFIPNPTDCGLSVGAAFYSYYKYSKEKFTGYKGYFSPYLGEEAYDRDKILQLESQYNHRKIEKENVPQELAKLICDNKIVGVVRGRYEIGPRALGNRSILCNSQNKDMRDILNEKVKHREWYRPFAPVCTAEDSKKYFTNDCEIPYMSVICYTRDEFKDLLPSITHVDGSCRLQTVTEDQHSFLYSTLREIEKINGHPIVLNTSFNPGGEPILNYYEVALEMLKTTGLDYVLIEDTLFWE